MKSTGKKKAAQAPVQAPTLNKYYIVAVEAPKTFTGIIGPLDVYTVPPNWPTRASSFAALKN